MVNAGTCRDDCQPSTDRCTWAVTCQGLSGSSGTPVSGAGGTASDAWTSSACRTVSRTWSSRASSHSRQYVYMFVAPDSRKSSRNVVIVFVLSGSLLLANPSGSSSRSAVKAAERSSGLRAMSVISQFSGGLVHRLRRPDVCAQTPARSCSSGRLTRDPGGLVQAPPPIHHLPHTHAHPHSHQ